MLSRDTHPIKKKYYKLPRAYIRGSNQCKILTRIMARPADSLPQHLGVRQIGPDEFESLHHPVRMGNGANIGYGGTLLGVAVSAACSVLPKELHLFSLLGNYLNASSTDAPLRCRVVVTRRSKAFATCRVTITQTVEEKGRTVERTCMELSADFHAVEAGLLQYSAPPMRQFSSVENSVPLEKHIETLIKKGSVSAKGGQAFKDMFAPLVQHLEWRFPPESFSAKNLTGLAKADDDDRSEITERVSADWLRLKEPVDSKDRKSQQAMLAFLMDGGLSFLPLAHSNMFITQAGTCSSLDAALRVFSPDVDLSQWHMLERVTLHGGYGRTYCESRLRDESGKMVACMTQQCILRPKKERKSNL